MLNISGILLLRALQRETRARVLEVLIVSASPAQLIGGKIAGLATLAQAQVGLALLAGELVYSPAALTGPATLRPASKPAENR
ncbi:MAG: hypothetical protein HC875_15910 [Anaerolineales bacterium]|nr:hypothetical protein [Anaerolineales bacterium]